MTLNFTLLQMSSNGMDDPIISMEEDDGALHSDHFTPLVSFLFNEILLFSEKKWKIPDQ